MVRMKKDMLSPIKGFIGALVGVTLGGVVIGQVGATAAIPAGIRSATQSFIGLGVLGTAAKGAKSLFNLK